MKMLYFKSIVAALYISTILAHDFNMDDDEYMEDNGHVGFDIVVAVFITFILCMIAFHCYLKRKERQKIGVYMNLQ